jgi:hypothetical protein
MQGMYSGYQGFGATPKITFNLGPAWQQCMNEEIAKSKQGLPHDTSRCTALLPGAKSGVPTLAWVALGVAVVGGAGALYWFKFRKKA